ncbi:MAG: hypothetical protein JNM03_09535 [Sphingopyxis sp.]|uniref:hypothetical protein n=1 Tax=Sphingopyxis sp. TaxID=1908224 RepID=UPI001A5AAAE9|nr:hypothetical protein [Sphingopyxis sp.]MBL9070219.1 hypothetical protein [Sphingopyxis sp.]
MADLIELPQRCTCAEVLGEDPNCDLHGVATEWALENILPRDWQEMVLEQAAELEKLAPLAISLQATAEAAAHSASELTALRERVAELEGALYDIAHCHETPGAMREKARALLAQQGTGHA